MTNSVGLEMPDHSQRVYYVGQRVCVLHGCPQLAPYPEYYRDGVEAVISCLPDEWSVVVCLPSGAISDIIPHTSLYLKPSEEVAS